MLPINSRSSVLAMLLLSAAGSAFSETVFQLKNGDRITGKILSEDTNQVVVATAWSKELVVPLSLIDKRTDLVAATPADTNAPVVIVTNAPVPAVTNAPAAVAQATNAPALTATNAPVVATTTNAPAASKTNAPTAVAVAPTTPVKPKPPKRWNFDIQAGATLQHNQLNSETYTGSAKANYASPLMRDIFEYHANYGRTEGVVSANNMNGSWRIEHDISKDKRLFLFNSVGVGYDVVRKLDISWENSLGAGYKLIQTPKFALSFDSGVNYQEEYFSDNTSRNFFSLQVGNVIGWSITPRLGVDQKLEYYPRVTDGDSFRLRGEVNVTYKLNQSGTVYLNGSVVDVYDKTPPVGVTPNDLQVRSTIGVKF